MNRILSAWVVQRRRHLRVFFLSVVCLSVGYALTHAVGHYYTVDINLTKSLPYHVLWVDKTELPAKGDFIAFKVANNPQYPTGLLFGKIVGGVEGDVVTREGRQFYVNDTPVVYAKAYSRLGRPLAVGPTGTIPAGHFFVYTNHEDSYDSRYAEIGWVTPAQVVGRAVPLF